LLLLGPTKPVLVVHRRGGVYRHDLFASRLAFTNPHSFLIRTDNVAPAMRPVSLAAQEQVAVFFESESPESRETFRASNTL
jgi:hypothetical protein